MNSKGTTTYWIGSTEQKQQNERITTTKEKNSQQERRNEWEKQRFQDCKYAIIFMSEKYNNNNYWMDLDSGKCFSFYLNFTRKFIKCGMEGEREINSLCQLILQKVYDASAMRMCDQQNPFNIFVFNLEKIEWFCVQFVWRLTYWKVLIQKVRTK